MRKLLYVQSIIMLDNKKDKIIIDDLFRRLQEGEAAGMSPDWMAMDALLDRDMPVNGCVAALSMGNDFCKD